MGNNNKKKDKEEEIRKNAKREAFMQSRYTMFIRLKKCGECREEE